MGKSVKAPVVKDKKSKTYWKQIRSRQRQAIRQFKPDLLVTSDTVYFDENNEIDQNPIHYDWYDVANMPSLQKYYDLEIPQPKEIVNDYDYCDYVFDERFYRPSKFYSYETHLENKEKYKRK